jgi:hypothetical protein
MLDFFGASGGKENLGPVTQAGKVIINGHYDQSDNNKRRQNLKNGVALYKGPVDQNTVSIKQYELCMRKKTVYGQTGDLNAPLNAVFSTTNGFGLKNQTYYELLESIEYAGFAQVKNDHNDLNPSNQEGIALIVGGLVTIKNTGPYRINNGDLIYWELPDLNEPTEKGNKQSERQPFWTIPYGLERDKLSIKVLRDMLDHQPKKVNPGDKDSQLVQAVNKYKESVSKIAYLGIVAAIQCGLVKPSTPLLDPTSADIDNSLIFLQNNVIGQGKLENVLKNLAGYLGLMNEKTNKIELNTLSFNTDKVTKQLPLEFLLHTLAADSFESNITKYRDGHVEDLKPYEARLTKLQHEAISDNITSVEHYNISKTKRIFGRAVSPAHPGKPFDILLGHFMS